jgi:putative salt-induced outer membrane protein
VRRSVFIFVALCLLGVSARADQVVLKNGDRITGTIVKTDVKADDKTKTVLVIKTDFAGDIPVLWDSVASVVSGEPLHLQLKDGQTIVGPVTTSNHKLDVATATTGEVAAPKDAIVAVRNDAEQKTYDDTVYRLQHPRLTDFWSGLFDTGLSVTRGNSSTLNFTLAGKAVRQTDRDKISVYTTAVYASDNTTPPSRTTAHAIQGGIRGDLNVSDKFFVFGFTDNLYDEFQHLDLRNVIGGGGGYHLIKNENTTFDVFAGGDFEQEYFSPNPPAAPTSVTRKTGEVLFGEEYDTKLNGRTTITENATFYPNVSDTGQYRFQFNATSATKLKSFLSWQITFSDIYISNPLPGLKGNDLLLSTGLRLTFGKQKF